jgi:hypothetical protein
MRGTQRVTDDDIGDEVLSREDDLAVRAKVAILVPIKAGDLQSQLLLV